MLPASPGVALDALAAAGVPRILFISHAWGGGVEEHLRGLHELVAGQARVVVLRPDGGDLNRGIGVELPDGGSFVVRADNWDGFVEALRALSFARVHLHHTHGWPREVLDIDEALGIPLDFTVHDYAAFCPQYHCATVDGRYCGEPGPADCNTCVQARPHAWNLDIVAWRESFQATLARAERVFVPSDDVGERMRRHFPALRTILAPHPQYVPAPVTLTKVALLGALSSIKGLAVARSVAEHAAATQSPIRLRLIGHAAEPLPASITATGSYDADNLPELLALERPDVIWMPSQVPETFSLTLTNAMATGLPIVASRLGALPGRLREYPLATLIAHDATPEAWHQALLDAADAAPRGPSPGPRRLTAAREATQLQQAQYSRQYLQPLPATGLAADNAALAQLAMTAQQLRLRPRPLDRALLDLFRIGVRGGHRDSARTVELALESLAPGESHVVGRSQYMAATDELVSAQRIVLDLQHEIEDVQQQWRESRDAADIRELSAREYIAHLEGVRKQLQAEINRLEALRVEVVNSTSWRLTRPLRYASRKARRAVQIAAVAKRLMTRAPTLLPGGIARFRRGGWSHLRDRLVAEFRAPSPARAAASKPNTPAVIAPLAVPSTQERPHLSILIPVYGQHLVTFACLNSIAEHAPTRPFEVIVMDDCSPEPAAEALAQVTGVRFLRNDSNLGFLKNVNAAASHARGDWLLILNNDTVLCANAIDALLATFEQHASVGLVGAKLLNADGSLQEAGGIVWRDGSAWNWGRNEDRDDPRFNFVRDADYCSGAALALSRSLFEQLGGFDVTYSPAYYEDTDLAFRVRAAGYRVLYQPAAEVFHLEGVSHGRDENSGLKAYQRINAAKFFDRWHGTLQAHRENADSPEQEAHRGSRSNILIVEACMLMPDQDSGSVRMFNLLKMLRAEGHHVTYVADNLDGDPKYATLMTAEGVEVLYGSFAGSVRKVLTARGKSLDHIVFCRHYIASKYIDLVRAAAPDASIIFDTVDLHFLREEREAELKDNAAMRRAAAITRDRELRVIARSDVTLVVSEIEAALLARVQPEARVRIISNIHVPAQSVAGWDDRHGIIFVGGFRHPPNVDAIHWYASEVLPALRRLLPDVTTTVVGSNMPDELMQLSQPGLQMQGFVADLEPLLQGARVSIAPLRFGAGVKGKVNEAMNHGIPVVATACAVEGMHLRADHDVLVADDPLEFATAIARAYCDPELWSRLSQAGMASVRAHFSSEAVLPAVREIFVSPARTAQAGLR